MQEERLFGPSLEQVVAPAVPDAVFSFFRCVTSLDARARCNEKPFAQTYVFFLLLKFLPVTRGLIRKILIRAKV